jgi:transcriptional regulator with XRE-family HTH domain
MSLAQVADSSGLHPVAVARAERAGTDPRASTVAAIAHALGVPVCELFERTGHERGRAKRTRR